MGLNHRSIAVLTNLLFKYALQETTKEFTNITIEAGPANVQNSPVPGVSQQLRQIVKK